MPVIRVQALRIAGVDVGELLRATSKAVSVAFSLEPEQCWSCFTEVRAGEMFEGGEFRGSPETARHSPLVTIAAYEGRSQVEIASALNGVADAVVSHFGFEAGDVFVEYRELRKGTVHTGGEVRYI